MKYYESLDRLFFLKRKANKQTNVSKLQNCKILIFLGEVKRDEYLRRLVDLYWGMKNARICTKQVALLTWYCSLCLSLICIIFSVCLLYADFVFNFSLLKGRGYLYLDLYGLVFQIVCRQINVIVV